MAIMTSTDAIRTTRPFFLKGLGLFASTALAGLLAVSSVTAQTPIKVLLWGGPATTSHNVPAFRDSMATLFAANNMQMNYRQNTPYTWLHADSLAQWDVMLVYTTNQNAADLSTAQMTALTNWIASGRVMVAVHGTTNTFINGNSTISAAWRALTGGQFVDHDSPNHAGTCTFTVPGHPALQGTIPLPASATSEPASSDATTYWDEGRRHNQYASDTVVVARAQLGTTNAPWIWVRPQGQGWVYYNASGHNFRVWRRFEYKAQLVRALQWGHTVKTTGIRGREALAQFLGGPPGHIVVPSNTGFRAGHSIEILDMQGRRVFHRLNSRAASHDVSFLPAGTYGVNILSDTRETFRSLYLKPR
jgi:type 1 glutamine amidotransferase